VSLFIYVL